MVKIAFAALRASIVAFNAKMRAEHDESLAWLEVDEEPPEPPAPMPIRRREGEPDAETEEPQATADHQPVPPAPAPQAAAAAPQYRPLAICTLRWYVGLYFTL